MDILFEASLPSLLSMLSRDALVASRWARVTSRAALEAAELVEGLECSCADGSGQGMSRGLVVEADMSVYVGRWLGAACCLRLLPGWMR